MIFTFRTVKVEKFERYKIQIFEIGREIYRSGVFKVWKFKMRKTCKFENLNTSDYLRNQILLVSKMKKFQIFLSKYFV